MEPNSNLNPTGIAKEAINPLVNQLSTVCPVCHQMVPANFFFCPNCGAKVHEAPLSTTPGTQVWIYAFSIILPMICFIFVTRWPGMKYIKSDDPKAKRIGQIAWALIILSTCVTIYLAVLLTQAMIASSLSSINADMGLGS